MLISFVLPIYNVAAWLETCLDSILQQGLCCDDYEVIAVNDGSTDDSLQVLNSYKEKAEKEYPGLNFHIISQANAGASAARNAGLMIAKGDYIWWVDGDDYIASGCVANLLDIAIGKGLDILNFSISILHENGATELKPLNKDFEGKVLDGIEYICSVGEPPNVWSAIYRRQFLMDNDLRLKEGIVHEDLEFPPRAYFMAKRVSLSMDNAYFYRQREGSVMRTLSAERKMKKSKDLLTVCDSLYKFIENKADRNSLIYECFMDKIAFVFSQSLRNYTKEAFPIDEYKGKSFYPLKYSKRVGTREACKYRLINLSLSLYLFVCGILNRE